MIAVKGRYWGMSGVHVFTAGLVSTGQTISGMGRIFSRNVIVRIDVMMVEIKRELKIICHAIFELFAKIDNAVVAVFFFPARSNPLLEFPVTLRG